MQDKKKVNRNKELIIIHSTPCSAWESVIAKPGQYRESEGICTGVIAFVMEGSLSVTLKGCYNKIARKGEGFLVPPGMPYRGEALEDLRLVKCMFNMNTLLVAGCPIDQLLLLCKEVKYDFNLLTISPRLQEYLNLMDGYIVDNALDTRSFYNHKKEELFYLLFTRYPLQEIASFLYPIIGEDLGFREFVFGNCLKVKTLDELASLAHYSTSGFVKKFRRHFGESPYKWILRYKAGCIRGDILSRNFSLQEISHKYNFSSYPVFVEFCKTQLGDIPSAFLP